MDPIINDEKRIDMNLLLLFFVVELFDDFNDIYKKSRSQNKFKLDNIQSTTVEKINNMAKMLSYYFKHDYEQRSVNEFMYLEDRFGYTTSQIKSLAKKSNKLFNVLYLLDQSR